MRFFLENKRQTLELMVACTQGLGDVIENVDRFAKYGPFAQDLKIYLNNLENLEHHSQETPKPGR